MELSVMDELDPIELPIEGELDLHTFRPQDVKDLVPDYLAACRQKGIYRVRIIHGKGTGALRETVHAILRRLPEVASFSLAGEFSGSWGATVVVLKPHSEGRARGAPNFPEFP
jgi:DNA-nicking Smr family endonuclease